MTKNSDKNKTKQNKRSSDPHAEREAGRYDTPLPSRELVLTTMSEQGVPLSVEQLYLLLDIGEDERLIFNKRLNAMEREGQIIKNRKGALCIADKLDLISGVIQGHPDGFGFLIPDDKTKCNGEDLFLSPKEMSQVMHGDRAMVRMSGLDRRGRPEGKIVEVLERRTQKLVGRVVQTSGVTIVAAEDKRINLDILIPYHLDMGAKAGQVVMVELTEQPSALAQPMGKVVEILGNYADSGMEIEIALRKHNLPHEFSAEATRQAEAYPKLVQAADYKGRIDCREMSLITIDGETARDFDDAVYAEPQGKGWRLVVAIADVSFYVKPNDALDKGAFDRGNSVYFPRRVIPMLPEALSNGLCSLNPDVERLCMICDMQVDGLGIVKQYKFYPSVMRSKARMTYTQVHEILQNPQGELAQEYAWLMPQLQHLNSVYKLMLTQREKRGAIEFETSETIMVFNDQGKIDSIVPSQRNEAHKLIEECMLAANVCAADFLKSNEHPALYRIHEGPTPEKLELLRTFMGEFGFGVGGGDKPHAKDYGKLLDKIRERPDAQLLQTVLLRSMQQAVYSPDNLGHFGLAYEAYAHFTSPIRRYPDLLIHRAIKAVLNGEKYKAGDWTQLGIQCSMTERRADDATRDVTNWLKCFYMQDKIGEVFEGTVAGVTSFGLFVALDGVYVEGLLHVTELGNDYFHYDKARHEMAGERTGVRYRLGDRLTIKVVRVDLETTKIDFTLVNKINSLDYKIDVNSSKSTVGDKLRAGEQKPVKSTTKFGDKFGTKPATKTGERLTLGSKPKSKTAAKSSTKSASKNGDKNPPKPTQSRKSTKRTSKR
ncbi:ribonuclease R [Methylotenera sp.]|uniref:ribonuclease R n=1 Tax=Methylotenera sp. TaxID=2051956 RepID=UPI0027184FC8|nr:ribonuclease R [Methylotenera sp.]MDO9204603.1 ribonuclease R [Methylotenera sp.]MDP3306969.1 ribonuclease R [Methylotenera sp.]MDP3818086.1 ribonuclease R [Methylotenera sp.]MDZ4212331.1 ribonuclease R [Methylotenera sp.]